jgi:hypothetical protein
LGLGVDVRPIRDTNYAVDRKAFDALGILDTIGYDEFTNVADLVRVVEARGTGRDAASPATRIYRDSPIYLLKGPVEPQGAAQLFSTLKKSPLRFRTYDPIETPRLPFHTARKQVTGSFGVIAHLLAPNREGARVHNAPCALVCGMAMAQQKVVVMLQEEGDTQPIDYRDIVSTYSLPRQIPDLLDEPITQIVDRMQDRDAAFVPPPAGVLDRLDLGDVAAENEIGGLRDYYVPTGDFRRATQGHSRLVAGRKGSGKSALFYAVRSAVKKGHETLVLDMKPEGHQFIRLHELVLNEAFGWNAKHPRDHGGVFGMT